VQAVAAPLFTSQSGRDRHLLSSCQFGGEELRDHAAGSVSSWAASPRSCQPGQFVLNLANMRACLNPIAADRHQQSCDGTVARRRQAIPSGPIPNARNRPQSLDGRSHRRIVPRSPGPLRNSLSSGSSFRLLRSLTGINRIKHCKLRLLN
jgi:hypothetical protein